MNHRRSQFFGGCLVFSQPATQSHAQSGSSPPLGDDRQKCRRHVDRNRIRDSHELSLPRTPGHRLPRLPPSENRQSETAQTSHCFEKRSCSIGSRSRMLSFSTRFSRSANFASAFRSEPCVSTARSYSGPNFCRRPAVVLLRFRTYSQAATAMITITTDGEHNQLRIQQI